MLLEVKVKNLFSILQLNNATSSLLNKKGLFVVDDTLGVSLLIASNFKQNGGRFNIISSNLYNAQKVYDLLSSFIGEDNCLFFPVDEMLRVDTVYASKEMLAQRLYVMNELLTKKDYVLICHTASILRYLPSPELFEQRTLKFKVGNNYDINSIKNTLLIICILT